MVLRRLIFALLAVLALETIVFAGAAGGGYGSGQSAVFDMDEQLGALGRDELMSEIPQNARELMRETDTYELSPDNILELSPGRFFGSLWKSFTDALTKPLRSLSAVLGIIILCAMLGGLKSSDGDSRMSQTFTTVSVLCALTSVIVPMIDCVSETSKSIEDAALFMLTYVPVFSAALTASGAPVTGAAYNMFLFTACQVVSQVVAGTLIPLTGVYLALCVTGSLVPELNVASAAAGIKSIVTWSLGFLVTVFVGLLSVQTMVSQSADTVTVRTAKFMIGSFVPVVGNALSEAFSAAQGCFRLLKTTLGAYGILVCAFTFFPVLFRTMAWYVLTNLVAIAGDALGAERLSSVLKACSGVLGILLAVILCFALLLTVSTTVVMLAGLGAA